MVKYKNEKQLTFSLINDELAQAKTRKKTFFEEMEQVMPIAKWIEMIRICYYIRRAWQ